MKQKRLSTILLLVGVWPFSPACVTKAVAASYLDDLCRYGPEVPYASDFHAPPYAGSAELFLFLLCIDVATWPMQEALAGHDSVRLPRDLNLDVEHADPLCAQLDTRGWESFRWLP